MTDRKEIRLNKKIFHKVLAFRIGPTDGSETIWAARRVFGRGIDKKFFDFSFPGRPTEARIFVAYEVSPSLVLAEQLAGAFEKFGAAANLVSEESEIVSFAKKFPPELRDPACGTFFLARGRGVARRLQVVGIYAPEGDGLEVELLPFSHHKHKVVYRTERFFLVVPH